MVRTPLLAALTVALASACLATSLAGPAEAKPPTKNVKGTYEGTEVPEQPNGFDDIVFSFKVNKQGRKVKDFTIAMNVVCSGFPLYTEYVVQPMDDMKVAKRTGRFKDVVTGATEGGTPYRVEVAGRLKGTKVKDGTMSYDVGICQRGTGDSGPVTWKGERTSRR